MSADPTAAGPTPLQPVTLDTDPWTEPGADYAALRAEAIALVQAMSGDVWTDYNFSDPGVTIIEQLCYALTELPYRATLPMAAILSPPDRASLPLRRQGLLPVRSVMPCNPVTANDLRRLVIDRVPGVANVWFTPRSPDADGVGGLYDVWILPGRDERGGLWHDRRYGRHARCRCDDDGEGDGDGNDGGDLAEQVARCYTAHRALCEDIRPPVVLRDLEVRVDSVVVIAEKADPSDTLAQILFALGLLLRPEPRRSSLDEMLADGARTTDVFVGPLMLRGFIRDEQLQPFPASVGLDRIRAAIAGAPGVSAVDWVSATVGIQGGEPAHHGAIEAPPGSVFRLRATAPEGHPTIRMIRDRAVCQPDEARTRRRLAELWRAQRRVHPLWRSYPEHYPTPQSDCRPLASYLSVQDQFPANYGIGANALDGRAPTARLAQANQLKGYLMPFDQMLADYFAQLAFVRELLSVRAGGDRTYAVQSLRGIAAGADLLLAPGYEEGLEELSAETDPVTARQNAVLDLLLSFYGIGLGALQKEIGVTDPNSPAADRLVRAKRAILRRVDGLTRDRGKGLDYRRPALPRSATGVERTSATPLDLLWRTGADDSATTDGATADDPEEVRHPTKASFGKPLPAEVVQGVRHLFRPVRRNDGASVAAPWDGPSPLAGHRVASSLLAALPERGNYRIVGLDASRSVALLCVDADGRWWLIGEGATEREIVTVMDRVIRAAGDRHWRRRRGVDLRIVEWILLRDAAAPTDADGDGARYSFRVTAVLPADPRAGSAASWRDDSREILRANTPSHVALDCLYLDPAALAVFRRLHDDWLAALRDGGPKARRTASRRLERFLTEQGNPGDEAPAGKAGPEAKRKPASEPANAPPVAPPPAEAAPAEPAPATPMEESGADDPPPAADPAPPPAALPPPSADDDASSPPVSPPPPPPPSDGGKTRRTSWLGRVLSGLRRRKPDAEPAGTDQSGQEQGGQDAAAPEPSAPSRPSPSRPSTPRSSSKVRAAPPGAVGFDTATALTASSAAAFVASGFTFAVRYLSRTTPEAAGDLDASEVAAILGAGLALMAVQHVQKEGWVPSGALGAQYGEAAAVNAQAAGLAPGVTLWLDLEGVAAGTAADAVTDYCNAWFQAVSAAGFRPGLYVGANCGLTGQQLGALQCDGFWQSGSSVPAVEPAGYCMVQTIDGGFVIDGVAYDRDVVQTDNGGGTPVWMVPSARSGPGGVEGEGEEA